MVDADRSDQETVQSRARSFAAALEPVAAEAE